MSLHPELAPQSSLTSRLLSFVIWYDMLIPGKTYHQILRAWSWSWRCAFAGVWPVHDHMGHEFASSSKRYMNAGRPLAGAYRFCYTGGLADWSFHAQLYFPFFNSHAHNFCCTRDLAHRTIWELRFENNAPDAAWRSTTISNSEFKHAVGLMGGHPMLDIPGWHIMLQRADFMHGTFPGLFAVACANVVWELMEMGFFGPVEISREDRVKSAYVMLKSWLRLQGRSISHMGFTLGSLGSPQSGNQPCFGTKAHDTRMLVSWLSEITKDVADKDTSRGRHRHSLCWAQQDLCRAMELAPRYLTTVDVRRIQRAGERWLHLYTAFAYESKLLGEPRWNLLPKTHQLIHLLEDCGDDLLNPNSFSGWTDEDFMGHVRKMAGGCARRTVSLSVLKGWWAHAQSNWHAQFGT